jgi:hypothetical protein
LVFRGGGHDGVGVEAPAAALLIIATDMSIMVITIMMAMIGTDERRYDGDGRAGHDHHRRRHPRWFRFLMVRQGTQISARGKVILVPQPSSRRHPCRA